MCRIPSVSILLVTSGAGPTPEKFAGGVVLCGTLGRHRPLKAATLVQTSASAVGWFASAVGRDLLRRGRTSGSGGRMIMLLSGKGAQC